MSDDLNVTDKLREWSEGKRDALDELLPVVYRELHRQAARFLRRERPDHTLQPTALINEAFLRLVDQRDMEWESRTHFYAIAANTMRRILVDHARSRNRDKRGGDAVRISLDDAPEVAVGSGNTDLIALDEALGRLEKIDARQARVVELRYFADLTLEQTAKVLGVSRTTVADDWAMARAWLHRELTR